MTKPRTPRLFPLAPLLEVSRHTQTEIMHLTCMSGGRMAEVAVEGLTTLEADRVAVRCGYHPAEIWADWYERAVLPDSCGTHYGHNRHRRHGEAPCDDCAGAEAAYVRDRREAAREARRNETRKAAA